MVPFAGFEMPVQYPSGVLKEHLETRRHCGLFDVSHMGQVRFYGADRERFMERVTVADLQAMKVGEAKLSLITNEQGGIKDDCIVSKYEDHVYLVINAGTMDKDVAHLNHQLKAFGGDVAMKIEYGYSLLAVQGPAAASIVGKFVDGVDKQNFMHGRPAKFDGENILVTRCGYTGEDGFEISVPHRLAIPLADKLCEWGALPAGLGARDSLRLEAGMCLYGHELNEDIDPISAQLMWLISKRRLAEGGFLGAAAIQAKAADRASVPTRRVGIVSTGMVAREETPITVQGQSEPIGKVTSGCPGPTAKQNVAQAYVKREFATAGTKVQLNIRGKTVEGTVAKMPFVPTSYYKAK